MQFQIWKEKRVNAHLGTSSVEGATGAILMNQLIYENGAGYGINYQYTCLYI